MHIKIQGAFQGVFGIPFLYGQQPSYLTLTSKK